MIDADEDQDRTANELAEAKREMRANKARLVAEGGVPRSRQRGTLSTLPSAPVSAPVKDVVQVEAAAFVKPVPDAAPSVPAHSSMGVQFVVAVALVAVLIAVWIVERRSAARDTEDGND